MDPTKATIVSIVPIKIRIPAPHINPSTYEIPAAKPGEIQVLILSEATYPIYMGEGRSMTNRELAITVAEQITNQYVGAQLGLGEDCQPGVFFVVGAHLAGDIANRFPEELAKATRQQRNWFAKLVNEGDDCWNRFHKSAAISDLQRKACTWLGIEREWNIDVARTIDKCPACKGTLPDGAVICMSCRTIINAKAYKDLGLMPAGV
jgi:hypothetical protein